MSKSWDIDPSTGDYLQENGAPIETSSLRIPAYIRTKTKRLGWLYAPDKAYGSDFHLSRRRATTTADASAVEHIGARALQPLVDDGRASQISVTATDRARNGVQLEANIKDATGGEDQLVLKSLGV